MRLIPPEVAMPIARSWRELDLAALCTRGRLVAFDLDNTLARSKMPMKPRTGHLLSQLTRRTPVAIISGGSFALFVRQILDVLDDDADRAAMHLMPTSGTRYYRWRDGEWRLIYAHNLDPADRAAAIASLERHARELGVWEPHAWGARIEDRGSQITFSALGQQAPVAAKEAWDPDNAKKNALAQAVAADLPHLRVRSGGSTSVDISDEGIDKAYAVRQLAGILGIRVDEMIFVGDRMDPDGNDYPAALAGAMPIRVRNPDETVQVIERIIALLDHRSNRPSCASGHPDA